MNEKEFYYYVEQHIKDFLPEEERKNAFVYVHPVRKINDTMRQGLSIRKGDEKVSPIIYLEDAWEAYQNGTQIDNVLKDLAEVYQEQQMYPDLNLSMKYEDIKDKIIFFVVSKEANKNNLKQRVYTDIGQGLVKVYEIRQNLNQIDYKGNIVITHDLMRTYGYDVEKIRDDAEKNTPRHLPATLETIQQILLGGELDEFQNPEPDIYGIFVLSNTEKYRGAGVLFYPDIQKRIAEHFGKSYYILPSSVHELLIIPENGEVTAGYLEGTVKDVNRNVVEKEDFLSDKVMYFDKEKEQLRLAIPDTPQHNRGRADKREAR